MVMKLVVCSENQKDVTIVVSFIPPGKRMKLYDSCGALPILNQGRLTWNDVGIEIMEFFDKVE